MTNSVFWKCFPSQSDFSCFSSLEKQAGHFTGVLCGFPRPQSGADDSDDGGDGGGSGGGTAQSTRMTSPGKVQLTASLQSQRDGWKFSLAMFEPSCMLKMKQLNFFISLICLLSYTVELIAKLRLIKKKRHVLKLYDRYIIACVIWKGCNKNYFQVWQHFLHARFEVIFNILVTSKITLNAFIGYSPPGSESTVQMRVCVIISAIIRRD